MNFDWAILRPEHGALAGSMLGGFRQPDIAIAPDDGDVYLWRWYIVPRNPHGNAYLHVQVRDDPLRPLHDHPWNNTSVILAGGYDEQYQHPPYGAQQMRCAREGAVIHRQAEEAHRLLLAPGMPYTMTLFTTGPWRRHWGFWFPDGWRNQREVIENLPDGRSIFKDPTNATAG